MSECGQDSSPWTTRETSGSERYVVRFFLKLFLKQCCPGNRRQQCWQDGVCAEQLQPRRYFRGQDVIEAQRSIQVVAALRINPYNRGFGDDRT